MKKFLWIFILSFLVLFLGCLQLGLRASPSLFQNFASSMFEECDTELAKNSIPANLKLLEGLLKNDPQNASILTTLAVGFTGYSLFFVEADEPERASQLYLRAKLYGTRALGLKGEFLRDGDSKAEHLQASLDAIAEKDFEALFWTTMSLAGWSNLNLDKPIALIQLGLAEQCLKRLVEIQPDYLYGLPHILMGVSLSARPPLLGGKIKEAQVHFEKALSMSNRKLFLGQYYFARYYAVRIQDRDLFNNLLQEIILGNPEELKELCLMNTIIQRKALDLRNKADDLFL